MDYSWISLLLHQWASNLQSLCLSSTRTPIPCPVECLLWSWWYCPFKRITGLRETNLVSNIPWYNVCLRCCYSVKLVKTFPKRRQKIHVGMNTKQSHCIHIFSGVTVFFHRFVLYKYLDSYLVWMHLQTFYQVCTCFMGLEIIFQRN